MSRTFIVLSSCGLVVSILFAFAWFDPFQSGKHPALGYITFILSTVSILSFIWTVLAINCHNPTPIILFSSIKKYNDSLFYTNEKNESIKLTGDLESADPNTNLIKITIIPGGCKFFMYVEESRKVELLNKLV